MVYLLVELLDSQQAFLLGDIKLNIFLTSDSL